MPGVDLVPAKTAQLDPAVESGNPLLRRLMQAGAMPRPPLSRSSLGWKRIRFEASPYFMVAASDRARRKMAKRKRESWEETL
jgi:hypothetical protein